MRLVELAEGSEEYREMAEGFKRMAPGYCILHVSVRGWGAGAERHPLWVPEPSQGERGISPSPS